MLKPAVDNPSPFDLRHGDCLELLRSLPDASVNLVLTDPPYGTTNLAFDKIKIDWLAWWAEVHRVTTPQAIVCCFAAQPFTTDLINSNRKHFRYAMVWSKTNPVGFLSANQRPLRAHEDILVFCRKFGRLRRGQQMVMQSTYNPQMTEGTPYTHHYRAAKATHYSATRALPSFRNEGRRHPTSVLTYGRDRPSLHPTAKPDLLLRHLIRSYSHAGDLVLDPFAGCGSSLLAAMREGRRAVGMEMDAEYFAVAEQRLTEALSTLEDFTL